MDYGQSFAPGYRKPIPQSVRDTLAQLGNITGNTHLAPSHHAQIQYPATPGADASPFHKFVTGPDGQASQINPLQTIQANLGVQPLAPPAAPNMAPDTWMHPKAVAPKPLPNMAPDTWMNQIGQPHPPAAPAYAPYVTPTQQIHNQEQAMGRAGLSMPQITQQIQMGASRYANSRVNQLNNMRQYLSPEMTKLLDATNKGNAAANWGKISGAWADLAKSQGYADPRKWLADAQAGKLKVAGAGGESVSPIAGAPTNEVPSAI